MRRRSGAGPDKSRRRKTVTQRRRGVRNPPAAGHKTRSDAAQLVRERDEALEREKATAEVLRVISSSPGELEPVFATMLGNAVRICEAKFGSLYLREGDAFRVAAQHNAPTAFAEERRREPVLRPGPGTGLDRAARTKRTVQIADVQAERAYRSDARAVAIIRLAGYRSALYVPMLKDDVLMGVIVIFRQDLRAFTDKHIELLGHFASQAVIAIENARLLSELRASLQQQTATSEVLQVISSSPGELERVFRSLLKHATRLCEANFGILYRYDGELFRPVALQDTVPAYGDHLRREPPRPDPRNALGRLFHTKKPVHISDIVAEPAYAEREPTRVATVEIARARTFLAVPMLKDDELLGAIAIYRQEVRPFTDKQIVLVQNFASQVVIAIENARLLNELRKRTTDLSESLEQQTATSEVLQVISSSPGELDAVFQAILANATRICDAEFGTLTQIVDGAPRLMFQLGVPVALEEYWRRETPQPSPHNAISRVVTIGQAVHVADLHEYQAYIDGDPLAVAGVELGGIRTLLVVPMLKDGKTFGTIGIYRQAVRPFTDKQIELVSNFAAQAAIAIENSRLLNELRQRTDDLSKSLEDLRTAQDRLVQTQKLASLGQLTAGIAHEIKNPLNFVNNFSGVSVELIDELKEALERVPADDKTRAEIDDLSDTLRDNLGKIAQHGKRADAIVKNMLLHSREGSGEHRPVDINSIVEESLNLAYHGARAERQGFAITLERSFDPAAGSADLFPQDITRVLLNLISNGFYAATQRKGQADGDGYEPTVTAATRDLGDRVAFATTAPAFRPK